MAVLSVRVPDQFKRTIKSTASMRGTSLQAYVVSALEQKLSTDSDDRQHVYTSDDFNEETKAAMAEPVGHLKRYSANELIAEMRTW